jgi:hypothetical protein
MEVKNRHGSQEDPERPEKAGAAGSLERGNPAREENGHAVSISGTFR